MKIVFYALILGVVSLFFSCKKKAEKVTEPVQFTSTTYDFLGKYDSVGKPDYLLPREQISASLLSFLNNILVDGRDLRETYPDLLNNPAVADITITQPSDVFITFIRQGAGVANTLGFYTYATGKSPATAKDIKLITYVFPNVGGHTPLRAGDKVKLGRFQAGTSIGFVLMRNSWQPQSATVDNKAVHFCSNDALNPEIDPKLKKHAVLIYYSPEKKVLVGFEDTDRTAPNCDHDFNDLEFYCQLVP